MKKIKIFIIDITSPEFRMPETANLEFEENSIGISLMIVDKSKPISGFAKMLMSECIEEHDLTLMLEAKYRVCSREVINAIVARPELRNKSMLQHLVLFPRMHVADVVFDKNEVNGKLITAVTFGSCEFDDILEVKGSIAGKGSASMKRFRARCHWFMMNGFEEEEVLTKTDEGLLPIWQSVMNCPGEASFAIVLDDAIGSLKYMDLPERHDVDLEKFNDAEMNLSDFQCEFEQYVNVGEEEELTEEED